MLCRISTLAQQQQLRYAACMHTYRNKKLFCIVILESLHLLFIGDVRSLITVPWKEGYKIAIVQCAARFGSPNPVSIIMVADDGTFSGTSEAVFILDFLQNQNRAPNSSTPCQQIITGTLFQQDVVVITSGSDLKSPHALKLNALMAQTLFCLRVLRVLLVTLFSQSRPWPESSELFKLSSQD